MSAPPLRTVLVSGGAGYVGSVLVPALLREGYRVKVLDLYLYGDGALAAVRADPALEEIQGDIRDRGLLEQAVSGCDAVVHLACISNDPSFELDPELGKSINYDAFVHLVKVAKDGGVKRFIYASSSSVYGIKEEPSVTEDLPLEPLTDYSKYKALCEDVLLRERAPGFTVLILRPSTVCGFSPRMRLDLTVNILSNHAIHHGVINVFGGEQMRPNIHIDDMVRVYQEALRWPTAAIDGKVYNVGCQNYKVREIAEMVRDVIGSRVQIKTIPTDDHRSYHVSSERIRHELGFVATRSVEDAVRDLRKAFAENRIPDPLTDDRYYNIRRMQRLKLQ
jgi:nucleoside-diphosphate-sugar epimerase